MTFPTNNSRIDPNDVLHDVFAYPDLNLDVYIEGNCFKAGAISMLVSAGCRQARSLEDAELVLFLGGEDINPEIYGEGAHPTTYFSRERDTREIETFEKAVGLGIPMFGVCRGMQFIHAMAGGKLYQDVDNHGRSHRIHDVLNDIELTTSSMHHQMCIPFDGCVPVAYSKGVSGVYRTKTQTVSTDTMLELEAAYYPTVNAFAVQGHPEVGGYELYTKWCLERLEDMVQGLEPKYVTIEAEDE